MGSASNNNGKNANERRLKKPPQTNPQQRSLDVYNSTSTGHQVGGGVSKPMSWHKGRTSKLQQQLRREPAPLSLLASLPRANAKAQIGRASTSSASNPIPNTCGSIVPKLEPSTYVFKKEAFASDLTEEHSKAEDGNHPASTPSKSPEITTAITVATIDAETPPGAPTQIFKHCTIYINGTTAPSVSDHVLKRHLCANGASIATMLHRKAVTHVILGKPNSGTGSGGAGGGLAAGKIQKELTKNGRPVKYVSVQWALDSIKAGKRLPETAYTALNMHGQSQQNIFGFARGVTGGRSVASDDATTKSNLDPSPVTANTTTRKSFSSKIMKPKVKAIADGDDTAQATANADGSTRNTRQ